MYQAILFDLDDTLFSLRGCEAIALQRTLESAGLLCFLLDDVPDQPAADGGTGGRDRPASLFQ